jgi:hypothetical protein
LAEINSAIDPGDREKKNKVKEVAKSFISLIFICPI